MTWVLLIFALSINALGVYGKDPNHPTEFKDKESCEQTLKQQKETYFKDYSEEDVVLVCAPTPEYKKLMKDIQAKQVKKDII